MLSCRLNRTVPFICLNGENLYKSAEESAMHNKLFVTISCCFCHELHHELPNKTLYYQIKLVPSVWIIACYVFLWCWLKYICFKFHIMIINIKLVRFFFFFSHISIIISDICFFKIYKWFIGLYLCEIFCCKTSVLFCFCSSYTPWLNFPYR